MDSLTNTISILCAFGPPDLSLHYLAALVEPVLEMIGMTAGAMLIAYAVSLPLGLYMGSRGPCTGLLNAVLSGVRAIPDLTLAIFCVIFVGVGPAAGMIAMAIFYTAAVAKIFGDLFRTADAAPLEALRATGASACQVAAFGLVPLKLRDLLSYGSYEFESAIRASVIVGAVGGGGLGAELVGTLNAFDFHRTATLILVLIAMVAGIDQITVRLRRNPVWLLGLLAGPYALWRFSPEQFSLAHAARTIAAMFPPELGADAWERLPRLLVETGEMALLGTALGVVLALPLGLLSARNVSPSPRGAARTTLSRSLARRARGRLGPGSRRCRRRRSFRRHPRARPPLGWLPAGCSPSLSKTSAPRRCLRLRLRARPPSPSRVTRRYRCRSARSACTHCFNSN